MAESDSETFYIGIFPLLRFLATKQWLLAIVWDYTSSLPTCVLDSVMETGDMGLAEEWSKIELHCRG